MILGEIGEAEVRILIDADWRIWSTGPACANGWPAIFYRAAEIATGVLTNDMTRWPGRPPNEPEADPQLSLPI
jgi:hypothetical protein